MDKKFTTKLTGVNNKHISPYCEHFDTSCIMTILYSDHIWTKYCTHLAICWIL